MVAYLRLQRLTLPIAPLLAVAVGLVLALGFLFVPIAWIEDAAVGSGLAAMLGAAQPPLGNTARMLLISGVAGGTTFAVWLAVYLAIGDKAIVIALPAAKERRKRRTAAVRRADAHPDAPARKPLSATQELGTPFLEVRAPAAPPAERALPADLDMPLAAFDPAAIPDRPLAWQPAPAATRAAPQVDVIEEQGAPPVPSAPMDDAATPIRPIARPLALEPGERIETFDLSPVNASDGAAPLPLRTARWLVEEPVSLAVAAAQAPAPPATPPKTTPSTTEAAAMDTRVAALQMGDARAAADGPAPAAMRPAPEPAPMSLQPDAPAAATPWPIEPQPGVPPSSAAARPLPARDPSASIHALLDRLEAAARPLPPRPRDGLEETLTSLRQMSARA